MAKCPVKKTAEISILSMPVSIIIVDDLKDDAGRKLEGQYDPGVDRIYLSGALPDHKQQETTLHEIIHAIDGMMGLNLSESTVRKLSVTLYDTFKRNANIQFDMSGLFHTARGKPRS